MSIVKCYTCDQNIDLDKEDADYISGKGWFHTNCEEIPKKPQDMTNQELDQERTEIEHASIMRKDEKSRWREIREEQERRK